MTQHLTSQEFVEAVDGRLASDRQAHVEACHACIDHVADLRGLMREVAAVHVPEPSPLFWEHFSRRIAEATQTEMMPVRLSWWGRAWRPFVATGTVLAAVLLAVLVGHAPLRPVAGVPKAADVRAVAASDSDASLGVDDESLNFVAEVASTISYDDLQQAARPTGDAMDEAVEQLTPEQRTELVRLLEEQMKGAE